jgi:hypothetical protein
MLKFHVQSSVRKPLHLSERKCISKIASQETSKIQRVTRQGNRFEDSHANINLRHYGWLLPEARSLSMQRRNSSPGRSRPHLAPKTSEQMRQDVDKNPKPSEQTSRQIDKPR